MNKPKGSQVLTVYMNSIGNDMYKLGLDPNNCEDCKKHIDKIRKAIKLYDIVKELVSII